MDQQARMVKTLVCLVVCMTGTSMLLSALDPSDAAGESVISDVAITQSAQRAVRDRVALIPERWHEVHVSIREESANTGLLTAVHGAEANWHFRVKANGDLSPNGEWLAQRDLSASPNAVCIQMQTSKELGGPTAVQWLCVRALIHALNDAIAPNGPPLAVVVNKQS